MKAREKLGLRGKVELFVTKGKAPIIKQGKLLYDKPYPVYDKAEIDFSGTQLIDKQVLHNIILNQGKDKVITSLTTGFMRPIARMAIGDRGTELYNETYRDDVDTTTLDVGTPTVHEVQFIKTFSALNVPITAFSNQANPLVNEVALVMIDILGGNPLPRAPVASPNSPDADEELFGIRAFKSIPFEAANEIAITIRYTIFIE